MGLTAKINLEKSQSHAYLLIGADDLEIEPAIERIIEKSGAISLDVIRIREEEDSASRGKEIKVEFVKEFIHQILLSPYGPTRIGILENCERLNSSSANILLKVLEEPPKNVILILRAKSENVLATIRSRCRVYKSTDSQAELGDSSDLDQLLTGNLATSFKSIEKLVKEGGTETFLNNYLLVAEKEMVATTDTGSEQLVQAIVKAQKRIKRNVNPRLVLENLIILGQSLRVKKT